MIDAWNDNQANPVLRDETIANARKFYSLLRRRPLKNLIWPEDATAGTNPSDFDNQLNLLFRLNADERNFMYVNGLDKEDFQAYLRGFKMTVFDGDWNRNKCKSPAKHNSS
jgi:hypothetical protein